MAEERLYTVSLIKAKSAPRPKRANRAIKEIKKFLMRHMKTDEVKMDNSLNEAVWARGRKNIPTRIRIKAVKEDDGIVWVYTPEAEVIERKKEEKEEKPEEIPEEIKEEVTEEVKEEIPEEIKEEVTEEVKEEIPEEIKEKGKEKKKKENAEGEE